MKRMDPKLGLALAILAVGSLASLGLIAVTPKTEQIVRAMPSQLIETLALEPRSATIRIHSQGSVEPRIEAELVPKSPAGSRPSRASCERADTSPKATCSSRSTPRTTRC